MTPLTRRATPAEGGTQLSRRSVRTERRLFLADGPNAVEAALESGCVEEVFAAAPGPASRRCPTAFGHPGRRPGPGLAVGLGEPGRVVALCRFVDVPLAEALAGARPGGDLRRRPRPRQRRHRDPLRRRGGRGRVVLAAAPSTPTTPRRSGPASGALPPALAVEPSAEAAVRAAKDAGLTVLAADGAGEVASTTPRWPARRPGCSATRPGGARRAGRPGRPPGRDPDPRAGREPQPLHRRRALPLRVRARSGG